MESTLLYSASTLASISRTVTRHLILTSGRPSSHHHHRRLLLLVTRPYSSLSSSSSSLRGAAPHRSRLHSFSLVSGGGGGGLGRGGGEGGGEGEGGERKGGVVVSGGSEEGSGFSSDVIILDVGGMTCGGCAASVKRMLESQPNVSSASVNLATETAIVWPAAEAKVMPYWQKQLGEALATHLTACGFKSNI